MCVRKTESESVRGRERQREREHRKNKTEKEKNVRERERAREEGGERDRLRQQHAASHLICPCTDARQTGDAPPASHSEFSAKDTQDLFSAAIIIQTKSPPSLCFPFVFFLLLLPLSRLFSHRFDGKHPFISK